MVVLLLSNTKNNRAKHFLGVFMITAFLLYLSHVFYFRKYENAYLFFDPVYIFTSLSVYPLYYWYIRLLTIETNYNLRNLRFLIPALLLALASGITYIVMSEGEKEIYLRGILFREGLAHSVPAIIRWQTGINLLSRIVFTIQVIYFLTKGHRLVIRYNKRVANFYSNLESRTIFWVNYLLYSFVATSAMSIVFNTIGRNQFLDSSQLLLIPSLIFSVLLFSIGYLGHIQNHTIVDLEREEKQQTNTNQKEYNQYQLKEQLLKLFETDRIYAQSDLKITQVSIRLHTNRTYISHLINNEFYCSFNEFVNKYRISEAKKMLSGDLLKNYSLNYISEAVGFGSLNTFIRVFKEHEGITPGRFREQIRPGASPVL
jgi:AraC-like DNA-binding protein